MRTKNIILTDRQELTRSDTKMLQGLSVLAMVILHLFDRLDYSGLYHPLLYFKGYPVIFYFAQLSDFCVMGFAFCSGYGLFKQYNESEHSTYIKKRLKSLWHLLINYWIILILFTGISIIVGNGSNMPGSIKEFIGNFIPVNTTYNGAWWYLFIYILLVLLSPVLFKICNKIPSIIVLGGSFVIYVSAYYVRFKMGDSSWILGKYGVFGMTLFEFIIGSICYKEKWISKAKCLKDKVSKGIVLIIAVLSVLCMLLGHTLLVRSLFVAPVTGLTIIFIFSLWEKPEWIKNTFLLIGKHSTNIWLIHMFFYMYIFKNLVFIAKYPLLILLLMMFITISCSNVINLAVKCIRNK